MFHSRELEVNLRVHASYFLSAREKFISLVREQKFLFLLTLQRYNIEIAVYEFFTNFFSKIFLSLSRLS